MSQFLKAPLTFSGILEDLYEHWAKQVMLDLSVVEEFHKQFRAYYEDTPDPVYLIRRVSGLNSGQTIRTETGSLLKATDNSPAWWIHYQLFTGKFLEFSPFSAFLESIPCHMFQLHLPENINQAGWHVAHIFDTKNGNVAFNKWDQSELLRRTARNIHPCNYFYIPKIDWRHYGGDPKVIAFFTKKFEALYKPIWENFLRMVDGEPLQVETEIGEYFYSFTNNHKEQSIDLNPDEDMPIIPNPHDKSAIGKDICVANYYSSRLCFRADVIEPLCPDDRFCICTAEGTFSMSKREFYVTFQNVVESKSYQLNKIYHYPKIPQKAMHYKIS